MKMLPGIGITVLFVVYGQLMTKWRVGTLGALIPQDRGILVKILAYAADPLIVSAYASSFLASIAWVFVVERNDVSIAFPVYIGLVTGIVAIGGHFLFHEAMSFQKILSITFILLGVALAASS